MPRHLFKLDVDPRWLSISQAAAYLSVSRDRVTALAQEGHFVRYKLGDSVQSRVVVEKKDLDAYVESCREPVEPT